MGSEKSGIALRRGERLTVPIDGVALGGDGVGRTGDFVLFVPFTVDGDEAEVEVTEVKKRYARGRLLRIVTPSRYRVAAPCPYYGRCGGCRMQHIAYDHQLELKQRQVEETFVRVGRFPHPPVAPAVPSPQPYAYRGKAEFHLAGGGDSPRRMGLMALASHEIVEIERCAILDATINIKYRTFRETLRRQAVAVPQERLAIWSDEPGEPPIEIATGPGRPPDVIRLVLGKRIAVPYGGFFQANVALTGELVRTVIGMAALTGVETVLDAYAGSGLFSLFLGPLAGRLYGIEGDREAARCARLNLAGFGLDQAVFFQGDVGESIEKEFLPLGVKADVVVLDPPRDGCQDSVLAGIASLRPARIIYVSCNPATQARDCRRLTDLGYALRILQPFDMFPQTAHIEVVALLTPAAEKE